MMWVIRMDEVQKLRVVFDSMKDQALAQLRPYFADFLRIFECGFDPENDGDLAVGAAIFCDAMMTKTKGIYMPVRHERIKRIAYEQPDYDETDLLAIQVMALFVCNELDETDVEMDDD